MQAEFEFLAIREKIDLRVGRRDVGNFRRLVDGAGDAYRQRLRNDLALERHGLVSLIEGQGLERRPTSYFLATYLSDTGDFYLRNVGIDSVNSPDPRLKVGGVVLLDLYFGFKSVISPLVIAHSNAFEAANEIERVRSKLSESSKRKGLGVQSRGIDILLEPLTREYNEARTKLRQDPTGVLLIETELRKVIKRKTMTGNQLREVIIAGAQLGVDAYKEFYPDVDKVVKRLFPSDSNEL